MGTPLEAIGIVLETYFEFGFPNAYAIGDSLNSRINVLLFFNDQSNIF
jgi:hypothetical protein